MYPYRKVLPTRLFSTIYSKGYGFASNLCGTQSVSIQVNKPLSLYLRQFSATAKFEMLAKRSILPHRYSNKAKLHYTISEYREKYLYRFFLITLLLGPKVLGILSQPSHNNSLDFGLFLLAQLV